MDEDYYEIRVSDIAEIFCMDKKGAYKDMLDASNSFFERQFTILTANKERLQCESFIMRHNERLFVSVATSVGISHIQ